jgi:sarcosine oxidase subunit beta
MLKNLLIRRVWRGCYPMTPDGIPIIGRVPGLKGLILAVGMCGQGFMMGPGVAVNIASMICDGRSSLPEDVQRTFRFDRDFYASKTERLK